MSMTVGPKDESLRKKSSKNLQLLRRVVGGVIITAGSLLVLVSQYVDALQSCSSTPQGSLCEPLELGDLAPLLVLGILLLVPAWTELTVAGVSLRRKVEETQRQQDDLRQVIELRVAVEQLKAPDGKDKSDDGSGEASVPEKDELFQELRQLLSQVQRQSTKGRASMSSLRRLEEIESIVTLALRHPEAITIEELRTVIETAKSLLSSLS